MMCSDMYRQKGYNGSSKIGTLSAKAGFLAKLADLMQGSLCMPQLGLASGQLLLDILRGKTAHWHPFQAGTPLDWCHHADFKQHAARQACSYILDQVNSTVCCFLVTHTFGSMQSTRTLDKVVYCKRTVYKGVYPERSLHVCTPHIPV